MRLTFPYSAGLNILACRLYASTFWLIKLSFLEAVPTAELEPITETYVQADEVLTASYDEFIGLTTICINRRIWE
jgi:hypothetical protein